MDFLFLVLTAVLVFGTLIIANHFWGKDALFVIGIGCAIASNVYNIGDYPIQILNLVFGIDSVVYTVFVFIILFCLYNYGKSSTLTLLFSACGSLMLTAVLQFIASWASTGSLGDGIIWGFASYTISVIATIVAMLLVIKVFEALKEKNLNICLNLILNILLASFINSLIYFGAVAIISDFNGNFWGQLGASCIGKLMSMAFCLLTYFVCTKFPYKNYKNDNQNKNL